MKLGLALSLSSTQRGSGTFNPATLSNSGWWRGSYGGAPWVGEIGGNMTGATAPTVGTAVNTYTPATFNGTTQELAHGSAMSTFITTTTAGLCCLIKASAAPADPGVGLRYQARCAVGDQSGYVGITVTTTGVAAYVFDTGYKDTIAAATPVGNWLAVFVKLTGGNLSIAVNNGAYSTPVAVGAIGLLTGALKFGIQGGAAIYAGDMMEVMTRATAYSDTERTDTYGYLKLRYPAMALP